MAPHACPNCARMLHFEARVCPNCAFTLGYDPAGDAFLFLGDELTTWRDADGGAHDVVVCANNDDFEVCNWLVPVDEPTGYCVACRHNRTIPDLTGQDVPLRWGKIEAAKRRMVHTLLKLKLPLETRAEDAQALAFDFLYDPAAETQGQPQVLTGHEDGLVTLNLIEADDAQRERIRAEMQEPYRTLLGHFRHEVGHHFWNRLIQRDPAELERFRAVFGDETVDYGQALANHYQAGGNQGWETDFVSVYATSHPWEDFAETWAHYLHIVDALATIGGLGMEMEALPGTEGEGTVGFNPYTAPTDRLVAEWINFSFAENAINRSMGHADLYPFKLTPVIEGKLDYVNALVRRARETGGPALAPATEPVPQAA